MRLHLCPRVACVATVLALLAALWMPTAHAYLWHPTGPFVPVADLDFELNDGQDHKDVAMVVDPVSGYPHLLYFINSNHAWEHGRIFKLIHKYWDGTQFQTVTLETLPTEFAAGSTYPTSSLLYYYDFGVSINIEKDATGTYTLGGIAYTYTYNYAYYPQQGEVNHDVLTFMRYIPFQSSTTPGNHTITYGPTEDVLPEDMDWDPRVPLTGHRQSIALVHYEDMRPLIVFRFNSLCGDACFLTGDEHFHGQVGYREKDPVTGQWVGSQWNQSTLLFDDALYTLTGDLDMTRTVSSVALAMHKSVTTPWEPRIAFVDHSAQTAEVFYLDSLSGTMETAANVTGIDYWDYLGIHDGPRVVLTLDSTNNYKPCMSYDGNGVYYMERETGGWGTPLLIRADTTGADDDETVRVTSLDIHPVSGYRWLACCDRSASGAGMSRLYRRKNGTWLAPETPSGVHDYWMPVLQSEREYGMPLVLTTSLTLFGNLGFPNEKPNIVVRLIDSKDDGGISGGSVYIRQVGTTTEMANNSSNAERYLFWRKVPLPINNSITFEVRATHPDYKSVGYGSTVTVNWGECNDTLTIKMTPLQGCAAPPAERGPQSSLKAPAAALLPLALALMALGAWAVSRRRKAEAQ